MGNTPPPSEPFAQSSNFGVPASEWGEALGPLPAHHRGLWEGLGVESFRAWVVDLDRATAIAGRWAKHSGAVAGVAADLDVRVAGPGVAQRLEYWIDRGALGAGEVARQMLSPRRWLLAWSVRPAVGVLALVRFHEARTALDPGAVSRVQVLAEHWLADELAVLVHREAPSEPWNQLDRRTRRPVPMSIAAALLAALFSTIAGLWLAYGATAAADAREEAQRLDLARVAALADRHMVLGISHVLADGDYGEVQDLLSQMAAAEPWRAAMVTNAKGLVIAYAGAADGVRLGAPAPAAFASAARGLTLGNDPEALGRLFVSGTMPMTEAMGESLSRTLRIVGSLIALAGALGILLLSLHGRARYRWGWPIGAQR
jgi:hypothetical protein